MVDETSDVSKHKQVVICIHWVSKTFQVHEDFIGLYKIDQVYAGTLVFVIKDTLLRLNLSLNKIKGQCYDGAASMAGIRSGVAKQFLGEEPKAIYTHCHSYVFNLACSDAVKQYRLIKNALGTTYELIKPLKNSPRRDACFKKSLKTEASLIHLKFEPSVQPIGDSLSLKVCLIIMKYIVSSSMNALNL